MSVLVCHHAALSGSGLHPVLPYSLFCRSCPRPRPRSRPRPASRGRAFNTKSYYSPESGVQARTIKSNAVDQQISIYKEKMCEKCDPEDRGETGLVTRFALQMTPRTWDQWTLARVGTMGLIVRSRGGAGILNRHTASSWCTRDIYRDVLSCYFDILFQNI